MTVFPAGPAGPVTLGTTDGFAIYKGTRYPEAAWEFMKFLISSRYGRRSCRAHLLQPARPSLVDGWIADVREQYPEKAKDMDLGAFAQGHLKGFSVTPEIFENQDGRASWRRLPGNRSSRSDGNLFRTCARFRRRSRLRKVAVARRPGRRPVGAKGFWRRWRPAHHSGASSC